MYEDSILLKSYECARALSWDLRHDPCHACLVNESGYLAGVEDDPGFPFWAYVGDSGS